MQTDTKARMAEVYSAYSELQGYIGSKEPFSDKKNETEITRLLTRLKNNFHSTEGVAGEKFTREGLTSTLQSVQQTLDDISVRFAEGKKDYALWKIRSLSNYCVTCHTRFEVANDFGSSQSASLNGLNAYQKADYFFATRQFTKARTLFREVIASDQFNFERFDALSRLLVIETRVYPNPSHAIKTLKEIRQEAKFSPYEEEEMQDWIVSLTRWEREKPVSANSDQAVLAEAQRLIKIAHHGGDSLDGKVSFIELLRASALLHSVFDRVSTTTYHAKVLYLLGSIYSELPHIFQSELPEVFLEECIRKFPGTEEAKASFRVYKDMMQREFTGSSGTKLPAEELQKMEELKELAYITKLPTVN